MLLWLFFGVGIWTFAWGLFGVITKKPLTEETEETITDAATSKPRAVKVQKLTVKYLAAVCVVLGGVGLAALALIYSGVFRSAATSLAGSLWIWLVVWVLPAILMFAILLVSILQPSKVSEDSRSNYIDAMKTLITAAGLTVGFIRAITTLTNHIGNS